MCGLRAVIRPADGSAMLDPEGHPFCLFAGAV
jgi:hypothetical protein